ncbi:MAG: metal-dependent hydrolase [Woeseiaceae bacterium]|nr:metal-dependent hydrolase [Woeseiaceae bacterium]
MMSLTHATIAGSVVSLALGDCSPLVLGCAILGSQLPDIDTSTSLVGSAAFPVSRWIEARYPHRSVTHSFLATGAIALLSLPLYLYVDWKLWVALWAGHLVSIFSDTFTKQGVQLFYPAPVWCVRGLNPRRRLTTGGPSEYWVLAAAVALLVFSFYTYTGGGLIFKASQTFGIKSAQERIYNENAGTRHVYANIQGARTSDRSSVNGRFWILGKSGSEYVVTDGKQIYKTGETGQIVPSRLVAEPGAFATSKVYTLVFDDENPLTTFKALAEKFPNQPIYLTGSLQVDAPEEISITPNPNTLDTSNVSGSTYEQEFNSLKDAIAQLEGQYVTGQIQAKVFSSKGL